MSKITMDDYEKLEKAIASGARRVKFGDQEIEYRSPEEMLKALRFMEKRLGINKHEPKNIVLVHKKGLD